MTDDSEGVRGRQEIREKLEELDERRLERLKKANSDEYNNEQAWRVEARDAHEKAQACKWFLGEVDDL